MALRDLLAKFDIQVDGTQKLLSTDAQIRKTILGAERLGNTFKRLGSYLLVGTIINGIKNFIVGMVDQANALKYNAERLGITTDELQKYEYAAGLMGVSVKETTIAMRFFNRAVGEAQLGTKAAVKTFATLGVNLKDNNGQWKPTNELLFEASDRLKALPNQAQRTAYAMRLLGRNGSQFLPTFEKGSKALKEIFQDVDDLGGGFNAAFIEQSRTVNVELKRLKMAWTSIYVALATEILPVVKRWTMDAIKTAKAVIHLAKTTYGFRTALVALTIGSIYLGLKRLFALFGLGKFSIMNLFRALINNPGLVIFIGLITAAYLILDDLYTFMQGGDSIIGRFLDKIGGSGAALKFWHDMHDAFEKIVEALKPTIGGLKDFAKAAFQAFVDSVPQIIQWGAAIGTFVVSAIDSAISGLGELGTLIGGVFRAGKAYITGDFTGGDKALDTAFADIGKSNDAWQKRLGMYWNANAAVQGAFAPKPDANMIHPNDTGREGAGLPPPPPPPITVNQTLHVHGASDPHATASAVGSATKKVVKDAAAQQRDAWYAANAGMPATGQ